MKSARDATAAQVESLLGSKTGVDFDGSRFKKALESCRTLLENRGRSAIRDVTLELEHGGYAVTEDAQRALTTGVDRGLKLIFDTVFRDLRKERDRSTLAAQASDVEIFPTRRAKAG